MVILLEEVLRDSQTPGLIDTTWGDSGKGRYADDIAYILINKLRRETVAYRPNGGPNTGHTIWVDGRKIVFHSISSAATVQGIECLSGRAMAVNPKQFIGEVDNLKELGYKPKVGIDYGAHLIMPWHIILDNLTGKKVGTTGRGVGPCMETKMSRKGYVTVEMLTQPETLRLQIEEALEVLGPKLKDLTDKYVFEGGDLQKLLLKIEAITSEDFPDMFVDGRVNSNYISAVMKNHLTYGEKIKDSIIDVEEIVRDRVKQGKVILIEGVQGNNLDVTFGSYPYVTAGNTTRFGLEHDAGIGIDLCINVSKAYGTRVGEGPFPTELYGDEAVELRKAGDEFGATTGRPRRPGLLDGPANKRNIYLNSRRGERKFLALTKLDVLIGRTPSICASYNLDGVNIEYYDARNLGRAKPGEIMRFGSIEDVRGCTRISEVPPNAMDYLSAIERLAEAEIIAVGKGKNRGELIFR